AGLVAYILAVTPRPKHVDDDRMLEALPELGRHFGCKHHRFGIVAVDVENRRFDHLRDVGGVRRRARITRIGGETDLIVDDEMYRAAGAMSAQAGQAKTLGNDALAGEGGIARD